MLRITCLVLCLLSLAQAAEVFDVLKYGAKHEADHKNTEAIAKAIDAAAAAGGGIVHFPKGHYLTGPIHFKSNVHLDLAEGAELKFSDNFDDYLPFVTIRWEGTVVKTFSPLIYAYNCTNIGISGVNSTLDGSGKKWWDFYNVIRHEHDTTGHWRTNGSKWQDEFHSVNTELLKDTKEIIDDPGQLLSGFLRPPFFHPFESQHITLKSLTFKNSPFWTVHPTLSDYIAIDHVSVINPSNAPNTDGIDPDSCRHVTISNCYVSVGDDCVCIKSGKDKQGRTINRPSENITITDTLMHSGHGGIVIGSEMSGSVRHIRARNLHFDGTDRGIRIKSARGRGGVVEDVILQDITMRNISHEGITINTYYRKDGFDAPEEPLSERTPYFHDIHLEHVTGESKLGIEIHGLKEKHLANIELTNVHMVARQKMTNEFADNVVQTNVTYRIDPKAADPKHPGSDSGLF